MRVRFAVLELLAAIVVVVHNSNGVSTTNQPFSSSQARPLMCCLSILVSKLSPRKARPRAPVPQGVVTVPSRCKECLLPEIHGNRISNPTFKESPELPQADAGILLNTIGVALSVKIMTRDGVQHSLGCAALAYSWMAVLHGCVMASEAPTTFTDDGAVNTGIGTAGAEVISLSGGTALDTNAHADM